MAKDYGTRRAPRKKSSAPQQFLIIIVTFLLGYLTAIMFDVQKIAHWMNTQVIEAPSVQQSAVQSAHKNSVVPPKPKFEFYTLLANEKNEKLAQANKAAATAPVTQTPAPTQTTTLTGAQVASVSATATVKVNEAKPIKPSSQGAYLVQVAAFKARADAEHLKGMLTLKGFSVSIIPITNAKGNWFRVVTGPYSNKNAAQQAQNNLSRSEHLKGMITPAKA